MTADGSAPTAPEVHLDRIGTVTHRWEGEPLTVLVAGLSDAARERLLETGACTVVDELDVDNLPDVALVSTRLPRAELMAWTTNLRDRCPIVALAHTGGERLAVDVVRTGARGVIAEGNEHVLRAYLTTESHDTGILEVYERHHGQHRARSEVRRREDPVTGLPSGPSFEAKLAEATMSGDLPRVGFLRLLHLGHEDGRSSRETVRLVRKRIAIQMRPVAQAFEVELFALGPADMALLGPALSPNQAATLGQRLARIVETFSPAGQTLALAVGHAGSEVSTDATVVRQLAERAVEVAAAEQRSNVMGAETLSLGVSSTTELEAALKVLAFAEQQTGHQGLGEEVAEMATELAWELGFEGPARTAIQLAAHLADVGIAGLPPAAMAGEGLTGELLQAHQTHPIRSATYVRPLAGEEVASAVRAHHERWDGTGFPDGLAGDAIPMGARLIAIAEVAVAGEHEGGPGCALSRVLEASGTALDPQLVEVVVPLLTRRMESAAVPA